MISSTRFALPMLQPGQTQKEVAHNEALIQMEMAIQPVVDGPPLATPPSSPSDGDMRIVAGSATGPFAGRDGYIGQFTEGGWRFLEPFEGMLAQERNSGQTWRYDGVQWISVQIIAAPAGGISTPAGGTTVDAEARAAIASLIVALEDHGILSKST